MKKRFIIALVLLLLLTGCGLFQTGSTPASAGGGMIASSELPENIAQHNDPEANIAALMELLAREQPRAKITPEFLRWGNGAVHPDFASLLLENIQEHGYRDHLFYELFGSTLLVLQDYFTGAAENEENLHLMPWNGETLVLAFTGDINLADDWENMRFFHRQPGGISDCISPALLERMRAADILLVNNEFTFSNRGTPLPGKLYTFRAQTSNVELLTEMGVDIVSLANNHVFDYGEEAFYDTLETLQAADIPYVGAGRNREEAMQPQYFIAGGIKIAYVAASRAEKYIMTPEAEENSPGVLRTYDPALFLEATRQARENADIVIAYPHWGTENTTKLEQAQTELGQALVEAGVDVVIGAHPHCLQGLGSHNGKPIAYSLGNYWFNMDTVDTVLLEVLVDSPEDISLRVVPCQQKGGITSLLENPEDRQRIFSLLERLSPEVSIQEDGAVSYA